MARIKSGGGAKKKRLARPSESERILRRSSVLLDASGLGRSGEEKTFANFKDRGGNTAKVRALVERWVVGCARGLRSGGAAPRGIYLHGEPGSGKTHLACAAVNGLIREHLQGALFLKVGDIPRNDQEVIDDLVDPGLFPVVALDDVGAEKLTARMQEILFRLVDGRLWAGGVTLYTSNLDLDQLRERMDAAEGAFPGCGQRLAGRVREGCNVVRVRATGDKREEF
jgi:DNA replication protein DnaC